MSEITPAFLSERPLPDPKEGDKRTRGNVLVIAGGRDVPGASLLSGLAALRAGAGRLQIATGSGHSTPLAIAVPEAMVVGLAETEAGGIEPGAIETLSPLLAHADAILLGPGLQDDEAMASLAAKILERVKPGPAFVFDARAIKCLRTLKHLIAIHEGRVVLTPHAGEMASLLEVERSAVEANPAAIARQVAAELNAVVALKGAETFVASPQNPPVACREGNVGLATSGSGDVLAGVISGLLARGADPFVAACWGVFIHATAGDNLANRIGPLGFLASEILMEIPRIMGQLSNSHLLESRPVDDSEL
jgi:ADP-dependent NAD(P)H-hydrate dehydratase